MFKIWIGIAVLGTAVAAMADEVRIKDLVSRMTLEEKVGLLSGQDDGFETLAIPRLGIPQIKMADGPLGVRWDRATAFPAGLSMGASFDRDLVRQVAGAIALEARAKGRNMMLGPCVGITRIPVGGRNFEGMGEDPFLTAELAVSYVQGQQDHSVIGSVKHFGLNDQEYERNTINSVADERTMHEIHFPAFESAVAAGVGSVMASYNRINGHYASENDYLLNQVLKGEFNFRGFVVSDWGATHDTVRAALGGLDLEMPFAEFFGANLLTAVTGRLVPETTINDKVSRILRSMFDVSLFDTKPPTDPKVVNSPHHQSLALQLAREGQVLLKNEGRLLPLALNKISKIAVLGPNASEARIGGGGSSSVTPYYVISILDGLRDRLPSRIQILTSDDPATALTLAGQADVVILAVGFSADWEGEGVDRSIFGLPPEQEELIDQVLKVNPKTIISLTSGNPVEMNHWVDRVPALLFTSYAGQEGGHAVADVLTGAFNPSGHLPFTMLKNWSDLPGFSGYPEDHGQTIYSEGLYIGYRHFDKVGLAPHFPFGFGLSYTTFDYSDLVVTIGNDAAVAPGVDLEVTITNHGKREGAEVAQLYVEDLQPQIDRAVQELKGFVRVNLKAGQGQRVKFHLADRSFAYYDVTAHGWKVDPGTYALKVGSSSRDIRVRGDVTLN